MFPSILWSSWEAETCQLSTRPRLDASEQPGGRAPPRQDPQLPLQLPAGVRGCPRGRQSRRLVRGAFFAAHQPPFSTRLCPPRKASEESSPGSRRRESDRGGSPCCRACPCSRLPSLCAPSWRRGLPLLATAPPEQTLPLLFFPSKKETELAEGVQTEVVGTWWSLGAVAGWRYRHGDKSENNSLASRSF